MMTDSPIILAFVLTAARRKAPGVARGRGFGPYRVSYWRARLDKRGGGGAQVRSGNSDLWQSRCAARNRPARMRLSAESK
jgi:hypothetical protein